MDIAAHTLWTGAALLWRGHRRPPSLRRPEVQGALAMAALPDLMHAAPVALRALASGAPTELWRCAHALPGQEPAFPAAMNACSHHLHCCLHSGVYALLLGLWVWAWRWRGERSAAAINTMPSPLAAAPATPPCALPLPLPLLAGRLHILIDVPTDSAAVFPSPVRYPITCTGWNCWAWNGPQFLAWNDGELALTCLTWWWWRTGRLQGGPAPSSCLLRPRPNRAQARGKEGNTSCARRL